MHYIRPIGNQRDSTMVNVSAMLATRNYLAYTKCVTSPHGVHRLAKAYLKGDLAMSNRFAMCLMFGVMLSSPAAAQENLQDQLVAQEKN
jgi:hypothetical protein